MKARPCKDCEYWKWEHTDDTGEWGACRNRLLIDGIKFKHHKRGFYLNDQFGCIYWVSKGYKKTIEGEFQDLINTFNHLLHGFHKKIINSS